MPASPSLGVTLQPVAHLRREQAPVRAFIAVVFAGAFAWKLNSAWLWGWLAVYSATQAFEVWALMPFRPEAPAPGKRRQALALAAIFALALGFGALAALLWRAGGQVGPAAAVLLLCSGALNVLSTSRGCPQAFAAGGAPYVLILACLPLSWSDMSAHALQPHFLVAALAFAAAVWLVWRDGHAAVVRERETLAALDAQRAEAVAADAGRRHFTAIVSHELRTPLSAILAASATLQTRGFSEEDRRTAALVADSARMMRRLLDDLLELAKLEAGRMSVEAVAFDPRQAVTDTVSLWSEAAAAKGLTVGARGVAGLPDRILGDPLRLRQVLNNLISNAVKFTDAGGVEVVCSAAEQADGFRLALTVLDTGRGVDPDDAAALFTPFAQSRAADARLDGGAGLGLAISRELARVMGGDLVARPRDDRQGARFDFTVMLGRAEMQAEAPAGPSPDPADPFLRVLVVDDHPASRRALRLLMETAGAAVSEADSGEAALIRLSVESFDLVLSDVRMPGLDGPEAIRRLRAAPGPNRRTPVLGVTGLAGEAAQATCRAAGMHGCVTKPVEPAALYAAVEAALAEPEAREAASG